MAKEAERHDQVRSGVQPMVFSATTEAADEATTVVVDLDSVTRSPFSAEAVAKGMGGE